jgi:hypothetical protein
VLQLLRGEDLEAASHAPSVTAAALSGWRDAFLSAGEASLTTRQKGGEELENGRLKARLGDMLLKAELLEAKIAVLEEGSPLARRRSRPWGLGLAFERQTLRLGPGVPDLGHGTCDGLPSARSRRSRTTPASRAGGSHAGCGPAGAYPGRARRRQPVCTDAATAEHGDLLDIVRLSRNLATVVEAMDEARLFLTLPRPEPPKPIPAPRSSPEASRRLYAMGQPLRGTLAHDYLLERGITADVRSLPLRFHPSCYHQSGPHGRREARPALLAAVTDLAGTITGVHRTWLDPAQATKAQLSTPRKAMGDLLGNGVRFGVAREVLAAGEGLETMLSLRTVLPTMPMVAALSSNHLAALLLPAGLRCLYVAVDDDRAGRHAVERLRDRPDLRGVELRELVPTLGDFNEDLRRRGPEALVEALASQLAPADAERFLVNQPGEMMAS